MRRFHLHVVSLYWQVPCGLSGQISLNRPIYGLGSNSKIHRSTIQFISQTFTICFGFVAYISGCLSHAYFVQRHKARATALADDKESSVTYANICAWKHNVILRLKLTKRTKKVGLCFRYSGRDTTRNERLVHDFNTRVVNLGTTTKLC